HRGLPTLIIAAVGVFRFEAELGRKFRVTGVNPWNIVWQDRPITVVPHRKWEGKDFEKTNRVPRSGTAEAAHDAVTRRGAVAFHFVHFTNAVRQLAGSVKKIADAATEFARRTIIVTGRILNVGHSVSSKSDTEERNEQHLLFHK